MTRKLEVKPLKELSGIAELRELIALQEASRLAAELRAIDDAIRALRARRFDIEGPHDGAVEHKWRLWQEAELRRLNAHKAGVAAGHRMAAEALGRVRAECEVIGRLTEQAKRTERRRQAQRGSYIS